MLSILIPMLSTRIKDSSILIDKLTKQSNGYPIEIIGLMHDKETIGDKRNQLLEKATNKYINFIDDDDDVIDEYIELILQAAESDLDCITFDIKILKPSRIDKLCKYDIEYWDIYHKNTFYGKPTHIHLWKKSLIKDIKFPKININEDVEWAVQARKVVSSFYNIDKVLYYYRLNHK